MRNVITYAQEQIDTFDQRAFCPVDSLALAFLAYIYIPKRLTAAYSWEGMRIADLNRAEHFNQYFEGLWAEESGTQLLKVMTASPRFRDITVHHYVEKIDQKSEMQFCGMTFRLPNGLNYIAFKGTDATFVGWKEDFNLSFQCPVPSQTEALDYLAETASHCEGPLLLGGHSKGGNLAVYAAAMSNPEVNARIQGVYSHDGPGFLYEFMESDGYLNTKSRVHKTIPQSSVIGMLMEQGEYTVVKSDGHGLWQHDPSTWLIDGCNFVQLEELANNALFTDLTIGKWMRSRTREERELFVNSLYAVVDEADADTIREFKSDWRNALPAILKAMYDMDPEVRSFAAQIFGDLVVIGAKNVPELLRVHPEKLPLLAPRRDKSE